MIEGVKLKKLKVIADERGQLMEILRADDEYRVDPYKNDIPYDWKLKER